MTCAGHDGGVVIIGAAAHAFAPHGGKGLNLALMDMAEFAAALPSAP